VDKDFLSQDEVDALLKGVNEETIESVSSDQSTSKDPRPYNLASQERIVRGRMPTLESINDRFVRLLRVGLFNFVRKASEVTVGPLQVIKYGEFIRNIAMPSNLNIVMIKPLRGQGLIVIDPALLLQIVDNLFGGVGRTLNISEGREFTATENRIVQNLLSVIFSEYEKAWQPIYPIKCEFVRSEINTRFASIALPTEVAIVSSFNITLGDGVSGDFHICLPYTMIQPIRDILYSSLQGDQTEVDGMWVKLLRQQIQLAEIDLISNLCETSATLRQIMHMKKGDIVPLEIPEAVVAKVDGVPIFECKYGASNGQYALKVGKVLSINQEIT